MAEAVLAFDDRLSAPGGASLVARVCGRKLADGSWEGWIEFHDPAGGSGEPAADGAVPAHRTARETLQPSRRDLVYWATGLTHTFLEGALARALDSGQRERLGAGPGPRKPERANPGRPSARREREVRPGRIAGRNAPLPAHAVLDPFEVWAQGEELLRQELAALSPMHLRAIIRAFALSARSSGEVDRLDADALRREILGGVLARLRIDERREAAPAAPDPRERARER